VGEDLSTAANAGLDPIAKRSTWHAPAATIDSAPGVDPRSKEGVGVVKMERCEMLGTLCYIIRRRIGERTAYGYAWQGYGFERGSPIFDLGVVGKGQAIDGTRALARGKEMSEELVIRDGSRGKPILVRLELAASRSQCEPTHNTSSVAGQTTESLPGVFGVSTCTLSVFSS